LTNRWYYYSSTGLTFTDSSETDVSVVNKLLLEEGRNFDAVKWAVEQGAPLGKQAGGIPLLNAIAKDHKLAAVLLLSLGADPNSQAISVENCTHLYSKTQITNQRLAATAATPSHRETALSLAVSKNHKDLIELLLAEELEGSTARWVNNEISLGRAFLHAYMRNDDQELMRRLLEKGASVNEAFEPGCTPLGIAIQRRDINYARLFLGHKANVERELRNGHTPLTKSAKKGYLEFVELFLKAGADKKAETFSGMNPYDLTLNNLRTRNNSP